MSEGNAFGGQSRSRPVLGDVTNRISKRGFSLREEDGGKSSDFNDKDAIKRVCASPRTCSEINSLKGNVISRLSTIPNENKDQNLCDDCNVVDSLKGKIHVNENVDIRGGNVVSLSVSDSDVVDRCGKTELTKNSLPKVDEVASKNDVVYPSMENLKGAKVLNSIANAADGCGQLNLTKEVAKDSKCSNLDFGMFGTIHSVEANNEMGENSSADTSRTMSQTAHDFPHGGQHCDVGEDIISHEDHHNDSDYHNADNFVLSQSGSVDCLYVPQSQESRVDKSIEPKEDECAHMTMGTDAIKDCSCSFCTKAAYIWLDLNQKDIKARLAALKKSQKEASILAEKSCRIKLNEKHGVETITRGSKLESHLMHQWRSLFQHMSDLWEGESSQLEASLLPLNNLRDKCKAEMESINANQSEKH